MNNNTASYPGRVRYAIAGIMRAEDSRAFDTCFEMNDGAYVVAAIMREAEKNPALRAMIGYMFRNIPCYEDIPWQKTAAKLASIPDEDLGKEAAKERQKQREAFAAYMREMQAERAKTELTATGEQYVIPGCEPNAFARSGEQLTLF